MNRSSIFAWRPSIAIMFIAGFVALLVGSVFVYMLTTFNTKPTTEVRISSGVYHLWVADTDAELTQGLSGVEKLNPDGGLLMKFASDDTWGIWMKDMKIPLDIIWLNNDKKVIYLVANAQPEAPVETIYKPEKDARYVLELPAESIQKAGIKAGDTVQFKL